MKNNSKIISFIKNNMKGVGIGVVIICVLYIIIAGEYGYIAQTHLETNLQQIEQQINDAQIKRDSIYEQIMLLNNSNELIEKTARELYGMKRKDETDVFVIKREVQD